MDALSDVLSLMRLESCIYFERDFAAPWGMEMPDSPYAQFHMVIRGRCWLTFEGETTALNSGDVVMFPHGARHCLLDTPLSPSIPGPAILESMQLGQPMFVQGGERARLLCGHFELDRSIDHPLLSELPNVIQVPALADQHPDWFAAVGNHLVLETGSAEPGAAVVASRLAEVLFIQVLRAHLQANPPLRGFLAANRDAQVSRALKVIHDGFAGELTLAGIAREAGMSRSGLAFRFKNVLGETPMDYATRWRMLKAQELLNRTEVSLSDIADQVGYNSESAFSHAFNRQFGQRPGTYRREAATEVK
ncbi:MAG: AraC family transcriptional regulator [Sneathiella sp.]